jgi:hypothetical protein
VEGTAYGAPRLINVPERASLQSPIFWRIQPCCNVSACIIQKSQGRTQGAIRVALGRGRGSKAGIPSRIARRRSHFPDGAINFFDCVVALNTDSRTTVRLQQRARLPQVGEGMKIVWTLGLRWCPHSKEQKGQQPEYCRGKRFHDTHFSSTFRWMKMESRTTCRRG